MEQSSAFGRVLPEMPDGERYLEVLRLPWFRSVVHLQDLISTLTANFWSERGQKTLHLPLTTGTISSPMGLGSDSSPVKVSLFDVETYLADSMQFALEYGCRLVPKGCWYIMPSFRGESADASHLCQFFHSEVEVPGNMDDCISLAEDYVRALCRGILENAADVVHGIAGSIAHLSTVAESGQFERMLFADAAERLKGRNDWLVESTDGWRTLTRAGERQLMQTVGEPLWVTHWDHMAVPFYQAFDDAAGQKARNADLLMGIGEVAGLGERHNEAVDVRRALVLHGVDESEYRWYCRMKEVFPMQTSGFGMGIERFMAWVLCHDDVRDLQLLPRQNGLDLVP